MDAIYVVEKALLEKKIEPLVFLEQNKDFLTEAELNVLKEVTRFRSRYGKLPPTVKALFKDVSLEEFNPDYPVEVYLERISDRKKTILFARAKSVFNRLSKLSGEAVDEELALRQAWLALKQAFEEVNLEVRPLLKKQALTNAIVRFAREEASKFLFKRIVRTGFKSLDPLLTGGYVQGEVYVVVGRPKTGKTMYLLHSALRALLDGRKTMLISMEMDFASVIKRLLSLYFRNPVFLRPEGLFYKVVSSTDDLESKFPHLKNLYFVDGGLVLELSEVARYVEEEDVDVLFVDGGYLIPVKERFSAEWERVKYVVEGLKRVAMSRRIPIVATYQLNRAAVSAEEVGLEHVAYADAVGQTAAAVLSVTPLKANQNKEKSKKGSGNDQGLYSSDDKKRRLTLVANRYGPCTTFLAYFDWEKMNFGDVAGEYVDDLTAEEEEEFAF